MTVSEKINQFIAENGGNERDALNVALTRLELATEQLEYLKKAIEEIDISDEALGCGVEDENITNRYDAARYGFNVAYERAVDTVVNLEH